MQVVADETGRTWDLMVTCAGGSYILSKIGEVLPPHSTYCSQELLAAPARCCEHSSACWGCAIDVSMELLWFTACCSDGTTMSAQALKLLAVCDVQLPMQACSSMRTTCGRGTFSSSGTMLQAAWYEM